MMRVLLFVFGLLFLNATALCQNCQCVIVGDKSTSDRDFKTEHAFDGIPIEDNLSLVVDSLSDAYYIAEIIGSNKDCFLVNYMPSDVESTLSSKDSVWISKRNAGIGIKGTIYNGKNQIPLYGEPDYDATRGFYVTNSVIQLVQVLDYKDRWLKICVNDNDCVIIGWLAPENQCVNMYTMCTGE